MMRTDSTRARRAQLLAAMEAWTHERSTCADAAVIETDAGHAARLGLSTLAAILRAYARAVHVRELAPILDELRGIALGEATARVRRVLADAGHPGLPGIGVVPRTIVEAQYGASGAGRPAISGRGGPKPKRRQ